MWDTNPFLKQYLYLGEEVQMLKIGYKILQLKCSHFLHVKSVIFMWDFIKITN